MESSPHLRLVPGPAGPGTRTAFRVLFGVVFLVLIVFPAMMRLAADLFWFQEIGFQRVFATELLAKSVLFVVVTLGTYALLTVNLRVARRGEALDSILPGQVPESLMELLQKLPRLTTPIAIVVSLLAGINRNHGHRMSGNYPCVRQPR